jgi:nucleoside 2-deoxyribosyltransferase
MKVYIATKFENQNEFRKAKALLEANGHTITHDWTSEDAVPEAEEAKKQFLHEAACKDAMGVAEADAFVLLVTPDMGGAYVELGIALTVGLSVIIVGKDNPGNRDCIFYKIKPVAGLVEYVDTIEQAVESLNILEKGFQAVEQALDVLEGGGDLKTS